jgi:hypothetical protein
MSKRNEKEPYDIIIYSYLIIIKNLILRRLKNDEKITGIRDFDTTTGSFCMGGSEDGACEGGKLSKGRHGAKKRIIQLDDN